MELVRAADGQARCWDSTEAVANAGRCLGATCQVPEECARHCLNDRLLPTQAIVCFDVSSTNYSYWSKGDMIADPYCCCCSCSSCITP